MRQLQVQIPRDRMARLLDLAEEHRAVFPLGLEAWRADDSEWRVVLVSLPNDRVGAFVRAASEAVQEAQFTLFPYGALPIQTPLSRVQEEVHSVARRSTLELVLSALQSLGSWRAMILYALFSGVVATYGLIFTQSYLLVASMLIAPMGAPAMVSVVSASIGDWRMFARGTLRFVASLSVLVVSAWALGTAYGLSISTMMMEQVTALSGWTVLVAVVSGAAGAQSQVESERASLVTGTATGFLIAAALAPTSAVLGLSLVLHRWDYTALMGFQLVLQYAAIILGGWLALRLYGVHPSEHTVGRGSTRVRALLAGAVGVAALALLGWQLAQGVRYRKGDRANQAVELASQALRTVPEARLVEATAHFTRPDLEPPGEALLVRLVVEQRSAEVEKSALESEVRAAMRQQILSTMPDVLPFVDVSVLPRAPQP